MTQDSLIVLLYKIVVTAGEVAVIGFTVTYSVLAPWWKDPLGRTIVYLDLLIGAALGLSILSLFWHFNRLTSHIAAWTDLGILALIALVLFARIPLWIRMHLSKRAAAAAAGKEQDE